jgi:hypothetical protein
MIIEMITDKPYYVSTFIAAFRTVPRYVIHNVMQNMGTTHITVLVSNYTHWLSIKEGRICFGKCVSLWRNDNQYWVLRAEIEENWKALASLTYFADKTELEIPIKMRIGEQYEILKVRYAIAAIALAVCQKQKVGGIFNIICDMAKDEA